MTTDHTAPAAPDAATKLRGLLERHWTPPREIVSKLPKGGTQLDFVGHADITRIIIEEDPCWSWEPAAWTPEGEPLVTDTGKHFRMWGYVTIHGVRRLGVGTCEKNKGEWEKELIGDLLRNVGMRFGLAGALWSKSEANSTPPRGARRVEVKATTLPAPQAKRKLLEALGGDVELARQVWDDLAGDQAEFDEQQLWGLVEAGRAIRVGELKDTAPLDFADSAPVK